MDLLDSLRQLLPEGADTALDLICGQYPAFVYGSDCLDGQVPAFCFHSVEPESFETLLDFLARNDYYTLTPEELGDWMLGQAEFPQERVVLLSFDDGRRSVWSVAYPLLRRFEMNATVFLAPKLIDDQTSPIPSDVDSRGEEDQSEAPTLKTTAPREDLRYLTWEEISEMASSGVFTFETHSYEHSLIFTSPKIVDFVRPELQEQFDPLEFQIATSRGGLPTVGNLPLGAPLYTTAPRLSGKARYFDDRGLRQACADVVAERGGERFFGRGDWRSQLMSVVESYREHHSLDQRYESADETRESIRRDLSRSIEAIEKRPELGSASFLALPWGVGSELAISEAKALGLRGCFWEKTNGRYVNMQGQNPYYLRRMGSDFLPLLPGKGRHSLFSLFATKLQRRLRSSGPYLTH